MKIEVVKVTSSFCFALRDVPINLRKVIRADVIEKSKSYKVYARIHLFLDRQPVSWLKLFAGYIMSFILKRMGMRMELMWRRTLKE